MKDRTRSGLSIIELTVSLGIAGVLFGMIGHVIRGLSGLSSTSLAVGRIEEAANEVTAALAAELRWADPSTLLLTIENGSSRLDFRIAEGYDGVETVWSTPIVFRLEPMGWDANEDGVLDEGQIIRVQDGVERTLCRNVPLGGFSIQFIDSSAVVTVDVFAADRDRRALEATAETVTHLMNRSVW
jgi:hypothetical protein